MWIFFFDNFHFFLGLGFFYGFLYFFSFLLGLFLKFLKIHCSNFLDFFLIFFDYLIFIKLLFDVFEYCFVLFGIFSKLLRILLKVSRVTTEHQKWPKMNQNSIKSSLFAQRAKKASAEGQSLPQELEVGPRSGPYLIVIYKLDTSLYKMRCSLSYRLC